MVLWIPARVGPFSALLVLAPLFVARWAFVQYGDELRSHERTLDALVASVEAKDPASLGHSGRVAQLCEWTAESLGLGHREIQEVRTAGMLHDLGKLAVPSRVLRMRRERSDDEQVLLAEHPLHALEMLSGIDFVKGSLDGIAHHHERYDGRGFPSGLAGTASAGRADHRRRRCLRRLTTTRSYRSALAPAEALEELRSRGGAQLDPYVVSALGRALARHTWLVTERSGRCWPLGREPATTTTPSPLMRWPSGRTCEHVSPRPQKVCERRCGHEAAAARPPHQRRRSDHRCGCGDRPVSGLEQPDDLYVLRQSSVALVLLVFMAAITLARSPG